MSAAAHAEEEARHRRAATEEASKYDPNARAIAYEQTPSDGYRALIAYNPTEAHLGQAEAHRRHAAAHARAAAALHEGEERACGDAPKEVREACPLVTPYVARVVETPTGVELQLRPGAPGEAIVARMKCHFAAARTEGFPEEERARCPLFLSDSHITLRGDVIEISSFGPNTAALIRSDARRLFGAPAATAADAP